MNIYGIIILSALIFDLMLNIVSDYLNIKNLKTTLPDEFRDIYSAKKYKESQQYTKVRTKFGYFSTIFTLSIMLIFWFSGGFNYLDILVHDLSGSLIWRGLIYIGILLFAQTIISVPFSIYSTFVIEERFGFNKTTPKTFILDFIKSFFLTIIIGAPVLAGILYVLGSAGEYAWLYGWAGVTVMTLILQFIAPNWIMPLFNKFEPLEDCELNDEIFKYAASVHYPLKNISIMDGSKRSSKSNAFFTGFGKNKKIALFDTLLEKHTVMELVGILAHEIGHFKKKHIMQSMIIGILHFGVLFYLLSVFLNHDGLFEAFYMDDKSIYAGLIFFGMLYAPIEMILSIFLNMLSRKNEYEADKFAVDTTKRPIEFIDGLKKLSEHNLSNLTPHPFYVFLNYSHPTVLDRIESIRKAI